MKRFLTLLFLLFLCSCTEKSNDILSPAPDGSLLRIKEVSDSSVTLQWTVSESADFSCYQLFRSTDSNTLFTKFIDSIRGRTDTIFTIKNLTQQTRYYFAVLTVNKSNQSARSNIVDTTTAAIKPPEPPLLTFGSVGDSTITLFWTASTAGNFKYYKLFCSIDSSTLFTTFTDSISERTDTALTIRKLTPRTHYYFAVVTANASNLSAVSNIADTTTIAPPEPSFILIKSVSDSTITPSWTVSKAKNFAYYKLFCSTDSAGVFNSSLKTIYSRTDTQSFVSNLNPNTRYYVAVATYDSSELYARSTVKSAATKALIQFQFKPLSDTLHPVLTLTGLIGGLCKPGMETLEGTIAQRRPSVTDLGGYAILDSNITLKRLVTGTGDFRPLPFNRSYLNSLLYRIEQFKTENHRATSLSPWDSVLNLSGDFTLSPGIYKRILITTRGSLTIPPGAVLTGSVILAQNSIKVSGSTKTCLIEAKNGIIIQAGFHSSQFFSRGQIVIRSAASFNLANTIVAQLPESSSIVIDSSCSIKGTLIAYLDSSNNENSITFGENCRVEGTVITNGVIWIKNCTVIGHIWCTELLNSNADPHQGHTVEYWNFLWGMTVLEPKPEYLFPILGSPFIEGTDLFP